MCSKTFFFKKSRGWPHFVAFYDVLTNPLCSFFISPEMSYLEISNVGHSLQTVFIGLLGICKTEDVLLHSYYFIVPWMPGHQEKKKRIKEKEICWIAIWLCFQQAMDITLGPFDLLVAQLWACSAVVCNWSHFTVKWKMRLTKKI